MTIRSIDSVALNLPFEIYGPRPQFAGKDRFMEILLVRVETDSGLVGWGEAFGFGIWPATRAALRVAPFGLAKFFMGSAKAVPTGAELQGVEFDLLC